MDNTTSSRGAKSVEFSVAESGELSTAGANKRLSTASKNKKRRSSLFQALRQSFRRSGGERGADVETLRGNHGADFEAEAIVNRGGPVGCGCFGGSGMKECLLLIKGPFVFVYANESDKAPSYAISLAQMKAKPKGVAGGLHRVTLETTLGDMEYEISFKTEKDSSSFVEVVKEQAAVGETQEIRKRLGHENLLTKRSSVRYAETIALKKIEAQPQKQEPLMVEALVGATGGAAGLPM